MEDTFNYSKPKFGSIYSWGCKTHLKQMIVSTNIC